MNMSTTLRKRLARLELQHGGPDEVQQAAVAAISDEDLNVLCAFFERGSPLSALTHEERAALGRYRAECQNAALRIRRSERSWYAGPDSFR